MHLHNTLSGKKEEFRPQDPKRVTMYVCGPTVYSYAHIGNARPAVVFDVLARVLRRRYGDGSVVYALQPLVHEGGRLGAGIRRSIDLLQYRFGHNLLAFICASLVFSAAALAATIAIGALIPLPALFLLGAESNVARAITAAAWVTGLSAAVPLLPIWMALLYRRRAAAREGDELAARIAALRPAEPE